MIQEVGVGAEEELVLLGTQVLEGSNQTPEIHSREVGETVLAGGGGAMAEMRSSAVYSWAIAMEKREMVARELKSIFRVSDFGELREDLRGCG